MAPQVRSAGAIISCLVSSFFLVTNRSRSGGTESGSAPAFPNLFLSDVVVSNTDETLKNTDRLFNSEPGIAINPLDRDKVVISAFSGAWSQEGHASPRNAPLWYSTNGGALWTKEFTIPSPPGLPSSAFRQSPCDETFDYGQDGILYGTFLLNGSGEEGASCSSFEDTASAANFEAVYTAGTTDPANARAWQWRVVDGKAQPTTQLPPDQPWIVVNKDPAQRDHEKIYVAYQAHSSMQVAVAGATLPPDFTLDHQSGTRVPFAGNPGQRMAANHSSGAVYSLYEQGAPIDCSTGLPVSYMLNRSLDGGATWELNGKSEGIAVAQVCSHQDLIRNLFGEPEPNALVGGANALRGGIDAIAVDSNSGAVYVAYGEYDETVNRDRISIVRIRDNPHGRAEIGPSHFVSGTQHQSALPATAIAGDGSVGVLYDTADGVNDETARPYFSIHFALSRDEGKTFHDVVAQKFLLPADAPFGPTEPRPLGDYQQLKSVGNTFYGVFSGDGGLFGRPFHKIDPIFLKTSSGS